MYERTALKIKETPREIVLEKLRDILYLSGIPEERWPSKEARAAILGYIYASFGDFTPNELVIAYQLMIIGTLDWEPDQFMRFGMPMVTKMLKSYQRYRYEVYKELTPQLQEHTPTDQERKASMKQSVIDAFIRYKETGKLLDFGNVKYNYLVDRGLINLTNERKEQILDHALMVVNRMVEKEGFAGSKGEYAKSLSKEFVLKEYFDHLIEMEDDITLILEEDDKPETT